MVKVTTDSHKEGMSMESTIQFVQKLAENQKKQEKNKKRGNNDPESQKPNHQHSQGVEKERVSAAETLSTLQLDSKQELPVHSPDQPSNKSSPSSCCHPHAE
jgi:hypothetical protein